MRNMGPRDDQGSHKSYTRRRIVVVALIAITIAISVVAYMQLRGPTRSIEAFCREMEAARTLDAALESLDPTALEPPFSALRAALKVAPNEIEPQMAILTDYTSKLIEVINAAPDDPVSATTAWFDTQGSEVHKVTEAGAKVQDFTRTNCGFELDAAPRTIPE